MADNDIQVRVLVQTASGRKEIKQFNASLTSMGDTATKQSSRASGGFKGMFSSAKKFIGVAGVAGIVISAGRIVQQGFSRMMERGKQFEASLAELSAITGITGNDLEALGKNALDTSVEYGVAADQVIQANKLVASQLAEKIDFGTEEGMKQLQEVSEQAVVLARASGDTLSTAVQTTTTVLNQFNLEASETERIINSIAAGAKFGAAEAQQQSDAYREAGTVFASANREFEELNAATQVLAANAIQGSRAGTGLRNMMTILQSEADKLAKHGIDNLNVSSESFSQTLLKLQPIVNDTAALAEIFGRENLSVAQILIKNAQSVAEMTTKVQGTNVAYDQAETRLNTYEGAAARLSSAIDSKLIPAFQSTSGVMVQLINFTTKLILESQKFLTWMNSWTDAGAYVREEFAKMNNELDRSKGLTNSQREAIQKTIEALEEEAEAAKKVMEVERQKSYSSSAFKAASRQYEILIARIHGYNQMLDILTQKSDKSTQSIGEMTITLLNQARAFNTSSDTMSNIDPFVNFPILDSGIEQEVARVAASIQSEEEQLQKNRKRLTEQDEQAVRNAEQNKRNAQTETGKNYADVTTDIMTSAALRRGSAADTANAIIDAAMAEIVAYAIKSAMKSLPFPLNIAAAATAAGAAAGLRSLIPEFAEGGRISGPGGTRSDSVLMRGSRDEFMMNAQSSKALGYANLEKINNSPQYARSVANMMNRLPHLQKNNNIDMSGIESAVRASRSMPSMNNGDLIAAIQNQTSRLENVQKNLRFSLSEFDEKYRMYKEQESIQGRA